MIELPDLYASTTKNILSFSGGKDSAAMYLLAMERGIDFIPVCADTGNEHEITLDYVRDFHNQTGGPEVQIIQADFSEQIARKRLMVARDRRKKKDKNGKKLRYTNKQKRRILENMYPTGNPFLDLCMLKGRFPSRTAQFCTQELKRNAIIEQIYFPLIDDVNVIISWQGVRAEESSNRAKLPEIDSPGGGIFNYRPILKWLVDDVFKIIKKHNVKPNRLYTSGFNRVGCMPCINCAKSEIHEMSRRFPEHVYRIREWERMVGACSKRGDATFFAPIKKGEINHIDDVVKWSKTMHGGRKMDFFLEFEELDAEACLSAYGLCE